MAKLSERDGLKAAYGALLSINMVTGCDSQRVREISDEAMRYLNSNFTELAHEALRDGVEKNPILSRG
jgi:hypothetical protein